MSESTVERIARAVLYEGYILYPYRPCVKSQQRWTFGGLYPQAWTDTQIEGDRSFLQTECLIEGDRNSTLRLGVRCLHLIDRTVGKLLQPARVLSGEPPFQTVPVLEVGDKKFYAWQEATERDVNVIDHALGDLLDRPVQQTFAFPAGRVLEPLRAADEQVVGVLVREQQAVQGVIDISAVQVAERLFKVIAVIRNTTALPNASNATRDDALMRTLIATHVILSARRGEFLSLTDPPDPWTSHAQSCRNVGCWPVLVGDAPARDTVLASPIILYDYPQIAPESPGDLFDGCEIDEILSLRILTMTDAEKAAAASIDDKAKELLARTETLAREQLMSLHGTMRGMRPAAAMSNSEEESLPTTLPPWDPFTPLEAGTKVEQITLDAGAVIKPGDRVTLRPLARADIFDMVLEGRSATVMSIEEDFEGRLHVAVSIDDDPGSDLAAAGKPGHRFFFGVDEIEPAKSLEGVSG